MYRKSGTRAATRVIPSKFGESIENLGKIGCVGTTGAGKTRAIINLCNVAARKRLYTWNEREELMGTTAVHPYSLNLLPNKVVELIDNPGQNSLENLRTTVAQSGIESYNGIIVFLDALGFNFWNIGIQQAKTLMKSLGTTRLPISLIITKWDLHQEFLGINALVDTITSTIVKTVENLKHSTRLPFYNRLDNVVEYLPYDSTTGTLPFTQLEQILVDGLDKYLQKSPIPEFTRLNGRLIIRSLLLSYCNLFKRYMHLPDFTQAHPEIIIEEDIEYSLNYYRPTAYETRVSWQKMARNPHAKEPLLLLESFDFSKVANLLKQDVIFPSKERLGDYVEELKRENEDLEIVNFTIANIKKRKTIENILPLIETLTQHESFLKIKSKHIPKIHEKLKFSDYKDIKPPPKPKKWVN